MESYFIMLSYLRYDISSSSHHRSCGKVYIYFFLISFCFIKLCYYFLFLCTRTEGTCPPLVSFRLLDLVDQFSFLLGN